MPLGIIIPLKLLTEAFSASKFLAIDIFGLGTLVMFRNPSSQGSCLQINDYWRENVSSLSQRRDYCFRITY